MNKILSYSDIETILGAVKDYIYNKISASVDTLKNSLGTAAFKGVADAVDNSNGNLVTAQAVYDFMAQNQARNIRVLSLQEYNALSETEKNNGTLYAIKAVNQKLSE